MIINNNKCFISMAFVILFIIIYSVGFSSDNVIYSRKAYGLIKRYNTYTNVAVIMPVHGVFYVGDRIVIYDKSGEEICTGKIKSIYTGEHYVEIEEGYGNEIIEGMIVAKNLTSKDIVDIDDDIYNSALLKIGRKERGITQSWRKSEEKKYRKFDQLIEQNIESQKISDTTKGFAKIIRINSSAGLVICDIEDGIFYENENIEIYSKEGEKISNGGVKNVYSNELYIIPEIEDVNIIRPGFLVLKNYSHAEVINIFLRSDNVSEKSTLLAKPKTIASRTYRTEEGLEVEISGDGEDPTRSFPSIAEKMKQYHSGIRYVYSREMLSNPSLRGMLLVSFVIQPDGNVDSAEVRQSTMNSPALDETVIKHLQHWKFPRSNGGPVRVVYPFVFDSDDVVIGSTTPTEKSPPSHGGEGAPAPGASRSLRDLTPSLGKKVMERQELGGRREEKTPVQERVTDETGGGFRLTPLNAPEIQYITYFASIKRKIELVWQYPYEAAAAGIEGEVTVDFVIARSGEVESIGVIRGSGFEVLDDEAIRSIRMASRFDPIPPEYKIPNLQIRGRFLYLTGSKLRLR